VNDTVRRSQPEGMVRARDLIRDAGHVVVLTGAGVSAESGVPTFRGPDGLWGAFRVEDLATPEAFARDPRLVWEWYALRRRTAQTCVPNAAHLALAAFALAEARMTIVTQNVDGLHARAALSAAEDKDPSPAMPLEVHGSILRDRCSQCERRSDPRAVDATSVSSLPRCGACGGLLRPDVVWFGELLDPRILGAADAAAARADVCLVIGTSALVYPAAAIPCRTREAGGVVIEVNPEESALSSIASVVVRGRAAETVPGLLT
jgi:NAD-dependent deacetylase